MILFYVRHGDPIYDPDSLTPLGEKQADAVAKRLAVYGIDKVFSSTSKRAVDTAKPTCEMLGKEMTLLDFTNEKYSWQEFAIERDGKRKWFNEYTDIKAAIAGDEMLKLGEKWYEHPAFSEGSFKSGIERISKESDEFLKTLGYERVGNGKYKAVSPNDERVALFAHGGFGLAFLSHLVGIPYPQFLLRFDMSHSNMTVIEFADSDGFSYPRILTLSNDSHLFREGLPTKYNNRLYF